MGKDWYKPQTSIDYGPDKRRLMGEKAYKQKGKGVRSLKDMHIENLSTPDSIARLNRYLGEIRHAIYNWQVDGDHILSDTVSASQIAQHSIAGSCMSEFLELDGDITVAGWLSAGEWISAGSGFYTTGGYYGATLSATGNVSSGNILATGWISSNGNVSAASGVFCGQISTAGDVVGASGEFHEGLNTSYLSCTGDVDIKDIDVENIIADGYISAASNISANSGSFVSGVRVGYLSSKGNVRSGNVVRGVSGRFSGTCRAERLSATSIAVAQSGWFHNGWTGWFDDGTNFRVYVSAGLITGVENSVAAGHS